MEMRAIAGIGEQQNSSALSRAFHRQNGPSSHAIETSVNYFIVSHHFALERNKECIVTVLCGGHLYALILPAADTLQYIV